MSWLTVSFKSMIMNPQCLPSIPMKDRSFLNLSIWNLSLFLGVNQPRRSMTLFSKTFCKPLLPFMYTKTLLFGLSVSIHLSSSPPPYLTLSINQFLSLSQSLSIPFRLTCSLYVPLSLIFSLSLSSALCLSFPLPSPSPLLHHLLTSNFLSFVTFCYL